jgi:hypothetical protein
MAEMIWWPWDGWGESTPNEHPPMQGEVVRDGDVRDDQRSRSDASGTRRKSSLPVQNRE